MERKEKEQQTAIIPKWIAKFVIYIIIYHLIVHHIFGYTIVYMKTKDYQELEKNLKEIEDMLWWVKYFV